MALRDILVQINSYPEVTPEWALAQASAIARRFGARLSIGICRVHIPPVSNWLANTLINADGMIAAENHKSAQQAEAWLARFGASIEESIRGEALIVECPGAVTHWKFSEKARTYDLIVVPIYAHDQIVPLIEGLTFDTGRPVLLMTEQSGSNPFNKVVVGWDGSRAAARALGDALPFLAAARSVTIASVTGEKDMASRAPLPHIVRHLERHGITADTVEIPANGRDAGAALQAYCKEAESDLLVMGAYGHSRAREFILGGATRSVLENPVLPILLTH